MILFYKYHGAGNDFIIIDNRQEFFKADRKTIAWLCDRKFGIGADGLILLQNKKPYDFDMRYFNSDGNEGSMCGNGGRCIVAFARLMGLVDKKTRFHAVDGEHRAEIITNNGNDSIIKLKMSDVKKISKIENDYFLDTGSPHLVRFAPKVKAIDVFTEGKKLRNDERLKPGGANINFVQVMKNKLFVRTYERGVEDETLSCGTGATASALAYASKSGCDNSIEIITNGGKLKVYFKKDKESYRAIWLEGPVRLVYSGGVEVQ
jgi:diaminopimelate epimerase